jgi:hypothetical protein
MTIRAIEGIHPEGAVVSFTWDSDGTGMRAIHWVDGVVREPVITFGWASCDDAGARRAR